MLKHAHQRTPNRIVLQDVWKCVTKAKRGPKASRLGLGKRITAIEFVTGRGPTEAFPSPLLGVETSLDKKAEFYLITMQNKGHLKQILIFFPVLQCFGMKMPLPDLQHTHIMHEMALHPAENEFPTFVPRRDGYDAARYVRDARYVHFW